MKRFVTINLPSGECAIIDRKRVIYAAYKRIPKVGGVTSVALDGAPSTLEIPGCHVFKLTTGGNL